VQLASLFATLTSSLGRWLSHEWVRSTANGRGSMAQRERLIQERWENAPADVGSLRLSRQRLAAKCVIKCDGPSLFTHVAFTRRQRIAALRFWNARAAILKWGRGTFVRQGPHPQRISN